MTISDHELKSLANRTEQHERLARKRAWLFSLLPIFFAGLLLGYTIWQVQKAARELASVEAKLSDTNAQLVSASQELSTLRTQVPDMQATLDSTTSQLTEAQSALATATVLLDQAQAELATAKSELATAQSELDSARIFAQHAVQIDPMAFKGLESEGTPQARLLLYILKMQNNTDIRWNPSGASITEGFDSPNFATYVMGQLDLLPANYTPGGKPWKFLHQVNWPANGDIVYYASGYTMFYFELTSHRSGETQRFVIGMTPLGILSQEMEFAEILGYLKVPYP